MHQDNLCRESNMETTYPDSWPIVIFGDGNQARARRVIPSEKDESGIIMTTFYLALSPHMKDYYNIKNKDLNKEGLMKVSYPQIMVMIPKSRKPQKMRTIFILQDFDGGNDAPLLGEFPNVMKVMRYQVENNILQAKVASLENDMKMMSNNPEEYMRRRIAMIKRAREVSGDIYQGMMMPQSPAINRPMGYSGYE